MKTVQKITALFLAFTFLISSLGFTANKMVCLKSGKVKLSLVHEKECCSSKPSPTPVIKSDCCDIINTYFNLSDFQTTQKRDINEPLAIQLPFSVHAFCFQLSTFSRIFFPTAGNLPPPRSGRVLLSFISVLTI